MKRLLLLYVLKHAVNSCGHKTLNLYLGAIIKQVEWDSSKEMEKLSNDLDAHIADVRNAKLSDLCTLHEVTDRSKNSFEVFTFLIDQLLRYAPLV